MTDTNAFTIRKSTLWQAATVIFAVLVVLAIFTNWFVFTKGGRRTGFGSGKVVIDEYSDFQCPFCGKFFKETLPQIEQAYGDKVEIVYKHFPLSFHENAQKAAEASECARDQGKFWQYHDLLFENQGAFQDDKLVSYAEELGMDTRMFKDCLASGAKRLIIQRDFQEGLDQGLQGTPIFFINGRRLEGAVSDSERGLESSGQSRKIGSVLGDILLHASVGMNGHGLRDPKSPLPGRGPGDL